MAHCGSGETTCSWRFFKRAGNCKSFGKLYKGSSLSKYVFLKLFNVNNVKGEKSHEDILDSFGVETDLHGSTPESKKIAMNYIISKRMTKSLKSMDTAGNRIKRQADVNVQNAVEAACKTVTDNLIMRDTSEDCHPLSNIREISGYCNNLAKKNLGTI